MFAALDQTKGSDGITRQLSAKEVANLKAALGVIKPTKVDYVSHAQEKAQMQEEFPSSTDPTISKEKDKPKQNGYYHDMFRRFDSRRYSMVRAWMHA